MKLKINKKDIIVFDLDKTIWDCEDKYTNSIWAKQIIFPIIPIDDNTIIDDCGSICRLQDGFKEFLNSIILIPECNLFSLNVASYRRSHI
jgi:predicted phosphatase